MTRPRSSLANAIERQLAHADHIPAGLGRLFGGLKAGTEVSLLFTVKGSGYRKPPVNFS